MAAAFSGLATADLDATSKEYGLPYCEPSAKTFAPSWATTCWT